MRLEAIPGPIGIGPAIHWLGLAGFWVDTGAYRLLVDPLPFRQPRAKVPRQAPRPPPHDAGPRCAGDAAPPDIVRERIGGAMPLVAVDADTMLEPIPALMLRVLPRRA